jgi:hypothetical protein
VARHECRVRLPAWEGEEGGEAKLGGRGGGDGVRSRLRESKREREGGEGGGEGTSRGIALVDIGRARSLGDVEYACYVRQSVGRWMVSTRSSAGDRRRAVFSQSQSGKGPERACSAQVTPYVADQHSAG